MGAFFVKEILQAGLQIEKNGLSFYREVAAKKPRPEIREIFDHLADEEARHIQELNPLLDRVSEPPESLEREDYALYLEALVNSHVFREDGSGQEAAQRIQTPDEALELGARFEKDTILFFQALRPWVRAEDRPILERLIDWEREHLTRLARLKRKFRGN